MSKFNSKLEVHINSNTSVSSSAGRTIKPFDRSDIPLHQLLETPEYQSISCTAKVLNISMPKEVKPGLRKQDVTISDATSTARLVLWQDDIDKLVANSSYSFRNLQVR